MGAQPETGEWMLDMPTGLGFGGGWICSFNGQLGYLCYHLGVSSGSKVLPAPVGQWFGGPRPLRPQGEGTYACLSGRVEGLWLSGSPILLRQQVCFLSPTVLV